MKRKSLLCYILVALMFLSVLTPLSGRYAMADTSDGNPKSGTGYLLYLQFNSNTKDSSGLGNHADVPYGNITYEDGIIGKCAVFDGKSYLEIPDAETLDLKNDFTISVWLYKEQQKKDQYVPFICKAADEETWDNPYNIYEHFKNTPTVFLSDGGADTEIGGQFMLEGSPIDIHKWFLLTVTFNGKEVKIYQNKTLVKKQSVEGSVANSTNSLFIGMMDSLGEAIYYKGKMDELRVIDYAISANEVSGIYNEGYNNNPKLIDQADALVAYYNFEDNFKDSSEFKNDAEKVTEGGSIKFVDGVNGKAAKFTKGSYLEVEANDSINFDQGFSMMAWVCPSKATVNMPILNRLGPSTSYSSNDFAYNVSIYDDLIRYEYSAFDDYQHTEGSHYTFEKSMKDTWYHLAITFNKEEVRYYVNGKLVNKEELEDFDIAHASGVLMIGSNGKDFFQGTMDELKIYNYAISPNDIKKEAGIKDSISISKDNESKLKSLKVKDTVKISTSRTYIVSGKTKSLSSGVSYKSSNTKIFKVDKNGKITAVKKGKAKLTVTHGGISKTYNVTVK